MTNIELFEKDLPLKRWEGNSKTRGVFDSWRKLLTDVRSMSGWQRGLASLCFKMMLWVFSRRLEMNVCHGGSQWWTLCLFCDNKLVMLHTLNEQIGNSPYTS